MYNAKDWHLVSCFESNCIFLLHNLSMCTEKIVIPTSYILPIQSVQIGKDKDV